VEACEAVFNSLTRRYSTGTMGLAVAADATRLIRIGAALPGEFASWRYGPRFRRRAVRHRARLSLGAVAAAGAGTAAVAAAYATASVVIGGWMALMLAASAPWRQNRVVAAIEESGTEERIWSTDLRHVRLAAHEGRDALCIGEPPLVSRVYEQNIPLGLGLVLPYVNRRGARPQDVAAAVEFIAHAGGSEGLMKRAIAGRWTITGTMGSGIPAVRRLALEMAAHENMEAEALRGELMRLERAWQRAEGLAEISDGLLLERETALLAKMRRDLTPVG